MSMEEMSMQNELNDQAPEADDLASESDGAIERIRRHFALLTSRLEGRATGVDDEMPDEPSGPG